MPASSKPNTARRENVVHGCNVRPRARGARRTRPTAAMKNVSGMSVRTSVASRGSQQIVPVRRDGHDAAPAGPEGFAHAPEQVGERERGGERRQPPSEVPVAERQPVCARGQPADERRLGGDALAARGVLEPPVARLARFPGRRLPAWPGRDRPSRQGRLRQAKHSTNSQITRHSQGCGWRRVVVGTAEGTVTPPRKCKRVQENKGSGHRRGEAMESRTTFLLLYTAASSSVL